MNLSSCEDENALITAAGPSNADADADADADTCTLTTGFVERVCDEEAVDILYLASRDPYAYRVLRALGPRSNGKRVQVGEPIETMDVSLIDRLMVVDMDAASVAFGLLSKFGAVSPYDGEGKDRFFTLTSRGYSLASAAAFREYPYVRACFAPLPKTSEVGTDDRD